MDDLVSSIMPIYNRCNIIDKAINAAINQTYQDCKVLGIDDYGQDEMDVLN